MFDASCKVGKPAEGVLPVGWTIDLGQLDAKGPAMVPGGNADAPTAAILPMGWTNC